MYRSDETQIKCDWGMILVDYPTDPFTTLGLQNPSITTHMNYIKLADLPILRL